MLDLMLLLENPIKIAAIERILSTAIRTGRIDAELSPSTIAILKDVANRLMNADPTQQKRSAEWLARLVIRGDIGVPGLTKPSDSPTVMVDNDEDIKRLYDALEAFERAKPRLDPTQRDVNRYRTLKELETTIKSAVGAGRVKATFAFARQVAGATVIYHSADTTVYRIRGTGEDNMNALMRLGDGPPVTKWCTRGSYNRGSLARNYLRRGIVYVIYKSGVPFLQLFATDINTSSIAKDIASKMKIELQNIANLIAPKNQEYTNKFLATDAGLDVVTMDQMTDQFVDFLKWLCNKSESELSIQIESYASKISHLHNELGSENYAEWSRWYARRQQEGLPGVRPDDMKNFKNKLAATAMGRLKEIMTTEVINPRKERPAIEWSSVLKEIKDVNDDEYQPYRDEQAPNKYPECKAIWDDMQVSFTGPQPVPYISNAIKNAFGAMIREYDIAQGKGIDHAAMQGMQLRTDALLAIIDQRVLNNEKVIITSRGNLIAYEEGSVEGLVARGKWLENFHNPPLGNKSSHIKLLLPFLIGSLNQELDARRSEYSRYHRLDEDGNPMSITIRLGYAMSPQIYTDETGTRRLRLVEFTG